MTGRFISFEGGEGAGKTTQIARLAKTLTARGYDVMTTREPGGTPGAEAIRSLLLDPPGEGWMPAAEALLFAAARSDHVARAIKPAVERGTWVICDRFLDSSRAYQGAAGGLGDDAIASLHDFGSDALRPDLTILLTASPEIVARRLAKRDGGRSDAIGGRKAAYHASVNAAFFRFADEKADVFRIVDSDAEPGVVHARVMDAVAALLEPMQ